MISDLLFRVKLLKKKYVLNNTTISTTHSSNFNKIAKGIYKNIKDLLLHVSVSQRTNIHQQTKASYF